MFLPIKTGEGNKKRGDQEKRESRMREEQRGEGREKRREGRGKRRRKKRSRRGKGKGRRSTAASVALSSPAAPPATAPDGSAATPGKSSALFFFGLHFFPLHARRAQCTSAGRKKLVNVLMHSNQLMWAGLVVGSGSA
jgi:hypothetical protein